MCFIAATGVCFGSFCTTKSAYPISFWLAQGAALACFPVMVRGNVLAAFSFEHAFLARFAGLSVRPLRFPFLLGAIALTAMLSGNG